MRQLKIGPALSLLLVCVMNFFNVAAQDVGLTLSGQVDGFSWPSTKSSVYDFNGDGILDCPERISNGDKFDRYSPDNYVDFFVKNIGGENGVVVYTPKGGNILFYDKESKLYRRAVLDIDAPELLTGDFDNDGRCDFLIGKVGAYGAHSAQPAYRYYNIVSPSEVVARKLKVIPYKSFAAGDYTGVSSQMIHHTLDMSGWFVSGASKTAKEGTFSSIDLNGDGLPDHINAADGQAYIALGNGSFVSTAIGGQSIIRDFNNDGIVDIIVWDSTSKKLIAQIAQTNGSYSTNTIYSGYDLGEQIWSRDLNKDGYPDIIAIAEQKYIIVLENKGDGSFKKHEVAADITGLEYGGLQIPIDVADYNNDGNYELIVEGNAYSFDGCKPLKDKVNLYKEGHGAGGRYLVADKEGRVSLITCGERIPLSTNKNTKPSISGKPSIFFEKSTNLLMICWSNGADAQTPVADLTYSLRIGTTPDGDDIMCADALPDGTRRNLMEGNSGYQRQRIIDTSSWPVGKYYISVQAVDGNFMGSEFSEAAIFEKNNITPVFTVSYKNPYMIKEPCVITLRGDVQPSCKYDWDFSGATILESDVESHKYTVCWNTPGNKDISLTVSDDEGAIHPVYRQSVTVSSFTLHPDGVATKENGVESAFYPQAVCDVDLDGKYEVTGGNNQLYEYTGEKMLVSAVERLYNEKRGFANSIIDLNHDGLPDFISESQYNLNEGDRDFNITESKTGMYLGKVMDVNHDGWAESSNNLYRNNGDNTFTYLNRPTPVFWADVNNDGLPDLITSIRPNGSNSIQYVALINDGTIDNMYYSQYKDSGEPVSRAFDPIDPDPLQSWDYPVGNLDSDEGFEVFRVEAVGTYGDCTYNNYIRWSDGADELLFSSSDTFGVFVCDIDNNGCPDIVLGTEFVIMFYPNKQWKMEPLMMEEYNGLYHTSGSQFDSPALCGTPFLGNDGNYYLTESGLKLIGTNSRPEAPTGVRHSQGPKFVTIDWNPSIDKETPTSQMRYNISVKHAGKTGEGAYVISPLNDARDDVPVPVPADLTSGCRYAIPISSLPAGDYEVKIQGVDAWNCASKFSETYLMHVTESAVLSIPPTTEEGQAVTATLYSNTDKEINWDGAEVTGLSQNEYKVIWPTPGLKNIKVDGTSFLVEVKSKPDASFKVAGTIACDDEIEVTDFVEGGTWNARINGENADEDIAYKYDESGKLVIIPHIEGNIELTHIVKSDFSEQTFSSVINVTKASYPEVNMVTSNGEHFELALNPIHRTDAKSIEIYREGSVADTYILADVILPTDAEWIDMQSSPAVKTERYKLRYVLGNGKSAMSEVYQPMHVMINHAANGGFNLIWNEYLGTKIASYRILRGHTPDNLSELAVISGNLTSYTDTQATTGIWYYAVEAIPVASMEAMPASIHQSRSQAAKPVSNVVNTNDAMNVIPVSAVEIFSTTGLMESKGAPLQLYAVSLPFNATLKGINWSIVDGGACADINSDGLLTPIETGTVTVRATATDGSGIYAETSVVISHVSGIDDIANDNLKIRITFANSGNTIRILGAESYPCEVKIIDIDGRLMVRERLEPNNQELNISSLKPGIYAVVCHAYNSTISMKFIKR